METNTVKLHDQKRFLEYTEVCQLHDEYNQKYPNNEVDFTKWMAAHGIFEETPRTQFWFRMIKLNPKAQEEYLEREELLQNNA